MFNLNNSIFYVFFLGIFITPQVTLANQAGVNSLSFHNKLNQISDSQYSLGNKPKLLKNKNLQLKKEQLLNEAQEYFWGAVFLIRCDNQTMPFYKKMIQKKHQGVDVRLLVDRMGSLINGGRCVKRLRRMGLPIHRVNISLKTILREMKKFGNRKSTAYHPKFWFNESTNALVDGVNLMNAHILTTDFNHMYKDAGIYVKGPVVTDIKLAYISMWEQYKGKSIPLMNKTKKTLYKKRKEQTKNKLRGNLTHIESVSKGLCRFDWQDPHKGDYSTSKIMIEMLKNAKTHIQMTPLEYFLKRNHPIKSTYTQFYQTLDNKVRNENVGLDFMANQHGTWTFYEEHNRQNFKDHNSGIISKIINKKYKNWLYDFGLENVQSYIKELQNYNPNVQGWLHHSFNHSKILMIDKSMVAIGSHNMNDRSFLSDIESMLFCVDADLANQVDQMLQEDQKRSDIMK